MPGNGAGGPLTEAIFARMNIDATYLFCESDGTLPEPSPGSHRRGEPGRT